MSKKKPGQCFQCDCSGNRRVYVVARHEKGAVSVCHDHGLTVLKTDSGRFAVIRVDDIHALGAINARVAS